ncbi:MAG: response regulator [Euryarchaeota archaeon]|nr:response regulator [Euryarchaeota archaeon]
MKKILVVDDDRQMRVDLAEILTSEGYDVSHVGSGAEALERVKKEDWDIVLTDLKMPGMSGMELMLEIKKLKPHIKAIMITAFATVENAVEAMKKGASDYISKPFKINEIEVAVKRTIEEARFSERLKESRLKKEAPSIASAIESLSNPIRRDTIEYLFSTGYAPFMEMVEKLGIEDHEKLSFHLRKLKSGGVVEQDSEKRYLLTEEGRKIAQSLRNLKEEVL